MADADPSPGELLRRIRSWDIGLTELRTAELLAELPTKRLLMKYTKGFLTGQESHGNLEVSATRRPARSLSCVVSCWITSFQALELIP